MHLTPSHLKKELGGKMTSKALRQNHEAKRKALHAKIEGKRKEIEGNNDKY